MALLTSFCLQSIWSQTLGYKKTQINKIMHNAASLTNFAWRQNQNNLKNVVSNRNLQTQVNIIKRTVVLIIELQLVHVNWYSTFSHRAATILQPARWKTPILEENWCTRAAVKDRYIWLWQRGHIAVCGGRELRLVSFEEGVEEEDSVDAFPRTRKANSETNLQREQVTPTGRRVNKHVPNCPRSSRPSKETSCRLEVVLARKLPSWYL